MIFLFSDGTESLADFNDIGRRAARENPDRLGMSGAKRDDILWSIELWEPQAQPSCGAPIAGGPLGHVVPAGRAERDQAIAGEALDPALVARLSEFLTAG